MKPLLRRVGIAGRVIAQGIALLALMATLVALGFRLVVDPVVREEIEALPTWIAQHAVGSLDDPAALARELDATRAQIGTELSVYDRAGALVASNTTPPLTAPPAARDAALAGDRAVSLGRDHAVVGLRRGGVLAGYAVVRHQPPALPMHRVLLVLAACLALAGLLSVPLARSVVRPIVALKRATRKLGGGDLTTRMALDRGDEIGDLARAFDEMASRIATFVRAEKELLANVSHELRTPLSRIRVALELASDGDPARAQRYLPEIAQDLAELDQLVEDVLTAARLDLAEERAGATRAPTRVEALDVADLVERSRARFAGLYPERALAVSLPTSLPPLRGDPVMMRRVLDNLLDNAVKHAPAPASVAVGARIDGNDLAIEVRDDGPGMAPSVAERAFEPFYRGDAGRDRRTGGVGLGLPLVRRIVEAHGGHVDLFTAPGHGTTVVVRLPRPEPSPKHLHTSAQ